MGRGLRGMAVCRPGAPVVLMAIAPPGPHALCYFSCSRLLAPQGLTLAFFNSSVFFFLAWGL